MQQRARSVLTTAIAVILAVSNGGGFAIAEEHDSEAEHCVSLNRIDRTEIIDEQSILFYMDGGQIYDNRLPYKCPGLEFEETFMYRNSIEQLCNLDVITVLNDIGFGLNPSMSCGLGMFHPVSEEQVAELKQISE